MFSIQKKAHWQQSSWRRQYSTSLLEYHSIYFKGLLPFAGVLIKQQNQLLRPFKHYIFNLFFISMLNASTLQNNCTLSTVVSTFYRHLSPLFLTRTLRHCVNCALIARLRHCVRSRLKTESENNARKPLPSVQFANASRQTRGNRSVRSKFETYFFSMKNRMRSVLRPVFQFSRSFFVLKKVFENSKKFSFSLSGVVRSVFFFISSVHFVDGYLYLWLKYRFMRFVSEIFYGQRK